MLVNPQNLCPMFLQEQLASLLHATCLQEVLRDAASLVDISVPILAAAALSDDIKASLQIDPLAKWELNHCLQGSPTP